MLNDKTILITGGTGSFGRRYTQYVFEKFKVKKLIIFSRDEHKQHEMSFTYPRNKYPIRYFIGDIRDRERLYRAFSGVDYVIHAAALKHVLAAEYNPFEVVKTNIVGAQNIVEAAIDNGVRKVIALSTDKAVSPVNLYGATKLAMEKIFVSASAYVGAKDTRFAVVRYGNVVASRGSVIPLFLKLIGEGATELPVTDMRMTRFWITIEESVELVNTALLEAVGGEVFVPRIPSMKITDLVEAIAPHCDINIVGCRPGEKIHETLIASDEAGTTVEYEHNGKVMYVILSELHLDAKDIGRYKNCKRLPDNYLYRSDKNDWWLTIPQMTECLKRLQVAL
ncbi:UDP-N-acetylglucosamine 4,6-dehydratase (inverting) [Candidatus Magnetobacterium casense]|uniref:UDP-N-acetylglucosamine 4,6-dehydratase (Inverting) n=1 Tax=Candidatus Magnetobacterium casense TaxID=1455061 RepID=A0ABS6RUB0_9BACT|nr:UDP-N-acetylglucosamine 4,6-dehydratase (inverting) [Candidatus Magnetobacterium casensis]MBV6340220.1 UDP-N-acetylglucosamine 4,6-dehydratase (inverting) [Candidatus Magnetobacterium casensis]